MNQVWSSRLIAGVLLCAFTLVPSIAIADSTPGEALRYGAGMARAGERTPPEQLPGTLQALIDSAPAGTTLIIPRGIYRETATIDKPLKLVGAPGAEIRGSDRWDNGWELRGDHWYHGGAPAFHSTGEWCREGSNGRCNWPNQLFRNSIPLTQVTGLPGPGEFALSEESEIVIADDPTDALMEVTERRAWIITGADGVTIDGLTMRHAADQLHKGALSNEGYSGWTVQNNRLMHAHFAVVSIREGTSARLINNEIAFGGRLGIQSWRTTGAEITGNNVHSNNTEEFNDGWEAGGMKLSGLANSVVAGNEVHHNDGAGIWCDVGCSDVIISGNRVHENRRYGILYEISRAGLIVDNVIWENGWGFPDWGFGGGFVCQNCRDTEVARNIVAWNADGISIMSQARDGFTDVVNNYVHDNFIALTTDWSQNTYMLAWLEDWHGQLTDGDSNNRGSNNRYFHARPEGAFLPFTWGPYQRFGIDDLAGFNATPGEEGGELLGRDAALETLTENAVPLEPRDRVGDSP